MRQICTEIKSFLANYIIPVLHQPPQSSDLTPSDFHLYQICIKKNQMEEVKEKATFITKDLTQ